MRFQVGTRQFQTWMLMGMVILIYAVWSGKAASATGIFFLTFPVLCGKIPVPGGRPRSQWLSWPLMTCLFGLTMLDLRMSRSGDPWFSSGFHRTMIGLLGASLLWSGYRMRSGAVGKGTSIGSTGNPGPART